MATDLNKSRFGVFISYRRSDTAQVAPRLKKDLATARQDRIFYDRDDLFQSGQAVALTRSHDQKTPQRAIWGSWSQHLQSSR